MSEPWTRCEDELPPEGEVVEAKVDDAQVCRQKAIARRGRYWYFADGSICLHYAPTHWRRIARDNEKGKVPDAERK
jgi:hypothetical protein